MRIEHISQQPPQAVMTLQCTRSSNARSSKGLWGALRLVATAQTAPEEREREEKSLREVGSVVIVPFELL